MTPPGTFERVYASIRQRLRSGDYAPGARLEPAVLSDELHASVTPVRDALHRLTGERLVEAPRHEGFRVPMMTETVLRHLYAWHLDILLVALGHHRAERRARVRAATLADDVDEGANAIFESLAAASGNPEHAEALRNVSARLDSYRRFEDEFLDSVQAETDDILSAIRAQDFKALRSALVHYHRRRQRIVPELLGRLQERQ